ncbi:unnamed protein product [Hydatigera taeniaeformis]|uniref:Secreted protein n=1 Tax=Hydatigena taeniaeformis TaxID=6205 RepID=A0A0R3WNW6_HYDTA|nr:unnamed protein product [Hydatigera taeniaeformis]
MVSATSHVTMCLTIIYGIIVIFACVVAVPLGEVDSNPEGPNQIVYFGAFKEGGTTGPSKLLWWVGERRFFEPSVSGFVTLEGTEAPKSSSVTTAVEGTENTSEVPKLHSSFGSDSTARMRSTFSPLQVHYDDYNYPSLKS